MKSIVLFSVLMVFGLVLFSVPASMGEEAGEYPDDSMITTEINAMLAKDPDADNFKIEATTIRGSVLLQGFVNSKGTEARILEKIGKIKGVKSVKSLLTVVGKK